MIDHILSRLELADRFEANARRHQSRKMKAPNWKSTCARCLAEARRERAIANRLATDHGLSFDNLVAENAAERRAEGLWRSDIGRVTIEEILRCAAIAGESTMGSRRLARAVQRLILVTDILASANVFQLLLRWTGESDPPRRVSKPTLHSVTAEREGIEEANDCQPQ